MIITYFCALNKCSAACFFKKVNLKFIILTEEEYELSLFFSFYGSSVSTLVAKDFKRKSNNNNIFSPSSYAGELRYAN